MNNAKTQSIKKIDLKTAEAAMLSQGHALITVKRPLTDMPNRFYANRGDMLIACGSRGSDTNFILRIVSLFLINGELTMVLVRQITH